MSQKQYELAAKHGTPGEFSAAVWRACPDFLSCDEAQEAIKGYWAEWRAAADV